jgi:Ulp1 family protease
MVCSVLYSAEDSSTTDIEVRHLVKRLNEHICSIPLDAPAPGLDPFRISSLPGLIQDSWLTDEHINAGCDFINNHPTRASSVRALHSFFLGSLHLQFQRRLAHPLCHALLLDSLISNGSVSELLIPVHLPSHWALLYVDIATRLYTFIDSLSPSKNSMSGSSINLLDQWLSEVLNRDIALVPCIRPFELGTQSDSHSCGVAVLSSMAHYVLGAGFPSWTRPTGSAGQ